jgi:hypothetical protein
VRDAAGETSCPRYQVMLEQRQSFFLCKFHASSMFMFAESGAFSEEQQLQKVLFFFQIGNKFCISLSQKPITKYVWQILDRYIHIAIPTKIKPGSDEGSKVLASKTLMKPRDFIKGKEMSA